MDQLNLSVHGVIAKNSIDFVRQLYQQNQTAVLLRSVDDQERKTGLRIESIVDPTTDTGWAELQFTPQHCGNIAQISFTSGTEGKPKGILISHKNLADMADRLNLVMQMDSSIRKYVGVSVYHSFGFGRCRAIATAGVFRFSGLGRRSLAAEAGPFPELDLLWKQSILSAVLGRVLISV